MNGWEFLNNNMGGIVAVLIVLGGLYFNRVRGD